MEFCDCGKFLVVQSNNTLKQKCEACYKKIDITPASTLLFEEKMGTDASHSKLIWSITRDRTNPTLEKKVFCKHCKRETYIAWICPGDNMKVTYGCLTCHNHWHPAAEAND